MENTTKPTSQASAGTNRAAVYDVLLDIVAEERATLHALAIVLVQRLEPEDMKNPEDGAMLVEWRIAQVLESTLGSTLHESALRQLLLPTVRAA